MKVSDKLYVGFQRDRYNHDSDPRVLGFAVPKGETKAEKNRMETVDNWRDKTIDARTLDNVPTRGFKLVDTVSRYSTSNKLFRVLDPRGFELEITVDNLLDLIQNTTIVKGEIIDSCVWAQHNKVYLLLESSDEYKFITSQKKTGKTKAEEGKYYTTLSNGLSVFRFEGIFHHTYVDMNYVATEADVINKDAGNYSYHRRREVIIKEYIKNSLIMMNSGNKPSYVYTEFLLDENGNLDRKSVHVRKSHFKDMIEYDSSELDQEDILDWKLDPLQWINEPRPRYSYYGNKSDKLNLVTTLDTPYMGLWKSKEDAKNFDYSEVIKNAKPNMRYGEIETSKFRDDNRGYYNLYDTLLSDNAKEIIEIKDKRK